MRPVRSVVVVELLPGGQLLFEIDVITISDEWVELSLVGAMSPLDLPIQLWRSRLDVDVFHARVGDMPVEECLELVDAVASDGANSEGELLHDVVDEVDGVGLRVALVDLQRTNPSRVVDRRVLISADRPAPVFFSGSGT